MAVLVARLPWRRGYPVYLLSLILAGLGVAWASTALVLAGFLEFPGRPLPGWTVSNVVYDFWLLPALTLLLVDRAALTGRTWLYAGIFVVVVTVIDFFVLRYTGMLIFKNWTLGHTAAGAAVLFAVMLGTYRWLWRHFRVE